MAGRRVGEGRGVRAVLIGTGLLLTALFLVAPLLVVFAQAFAAGWHAYLRNLATPDTLHAIWLTVLTALIVVPINMGFGVAAAWAITRFRFRGRRLLITLIELPFSISPIIAGVIYLFLYGAQGLLGPWLAAHDIRIMFSVPAIVLVSLFVTSPFVARELIAFMQTQSPDDEEAARSLGAGGWQMFTRITLPNIRWALIYGAVLCTARTVGEFGAVSVVSGNIRGSTNTLPLQIELLYNDYNAAGAFAAATVLTLIGLVTILLKIVVEAASVRSHRQEPQVITVDQSQLTGNFR